MALLKCFLDHSAKVRRRVADDCFVNRPFPRLATTLTDDLEFRVVSRFQESASVSRCKSGTIAGMEHLLFLLAEVSLMVGHAVWLVSCKTDVV
jgi:hypothetical protein